MLLQRYGRKKLLYKCCAQSDILKLSKKNSAFHFEVLNTVPNFQDIPISGSSVMQAQRSPDKWTDGQGKNLYMPPTHWAEA